MKVPNPHQSLVLINKTIHKKSTCIDKNSNHKNNNENKNATNILKPKNIQEFQTTNRILKKTNPRLTIETSLNFKKKENFIKNDTLINCKCPTTVSTNISSIKNKHNKSISNNKRIRKKVLNINCEQSSINDSKLKNTLTLNNNYERTRSGKKQVIQKSY